MTALIIGLLAMSAAYCAVMYVRGYVQAWPILNRAGNRTPAEGQYLKDMENHTFHLGLCFILSIGFLGLIVD